MKIIRQGAPAVPGPPDWFTGEVLMEPVAQPDEGSRLSASNVHFAAGARTAWHTHPHGQTIHVLSGEGRCQRRGGGVEAIHPGDTVYFEPDEDHWHGASPGGAMVHLAMQQADADGVFATWGNHVTDAEYDPA